MLRRSVLFSPGDQPELLRKAPRSDADVVVFDLEDAVAPGRKEAARSAVGEVLADHSFTPEAEVCVRVTGDEIDRDLAALSEDAGTLDAVMLPKAESAADVERLGERLRERFPEREAPIPVIALVETARGVTRATDIADAGPTDAVAFGAEDLVADLGGSRTDEDTEVLYARQKVATAAAAADVDALDMIHPDIDATAALREETRVGASFGYDGKLAIHPAQVTVINEAFTPAPDERAWAARVLAARDEAAAADRGVFTVDGEMIDAPLVARAERIRERAAAAGIDVRAEAGDEAGDTVDDEASDTAEDDDGDDGSTADSGR